MESSAVTSTAWAGGGGDGGDGDGIPNPMVETAIYRHLRRGFAESARVAAAMARSQPPPPLPLPQSSGAAPAVGGKMGVVGTTGTPTTIPDYDHRRVLVDFLDPNAQTSISAISPTVRQQHSQPLKRQSLNERFQRIFQNGFQNRIASVPYQDARSKVSQTIPYVQVKCRFLESTVDLLSTHEDDLSENGGEDDDDDGNNQDTLAISGGIDRSSSSITNAWHTRPYCFVYFVTNCSSVEEYRTKIKPAIQIFLSQLDDLYQRQAMQLSAAGGVMDDSSPAFLLIYCPARTPGSPPILPHDPNNPNIPTNHPDGPVSGGGGGVMGGGAGSSGGGGGASGGIGELVTTGSAANRFGALAYPFRRGSSHEDHVTGVSLGGSDGDAFGTTTPTAAASATTGESVAGGGGRDESPSVTASASTFNPSQVLTKVEKEVARRLALDFPQGNVATITTLANDYHSFVNYGNNSNLKSALEELERNEWASVLAVLSKTIVKGFEDICNRLWAALRKISNQQKDHSHLGHYFLIKESLAFTYRQMNLPSDALLQYNELRAFLPDLKKVHVFQNPNEQDHDVLAGISGVDDDRKKKTSLIPPAIPIWKILSTVPLSATFRQRLRALHYEEYYKLASAVELYLWERETSLLFQMGQTVQVLQRTFQFCISLWDYESKQQQRYSRSRISNNNESPHEQKQQPAAEEEDGLVKVEEWAFCFCWDVRRAAQEYLMHLEQQIKEALSLSSNNPKQQTQQQQTQQQQHNRTLMAELVGRQLCDILAFARSRLHRLEELKSTRTTIRKNIKKYQDIAKPWGPWTGGTTTANGPNTKDSGVVVAATTPLSSISSNNNKYQSLNLTGKSFLQKAFDNLNNGGGDGEEDQYMTLYMDAMCVLIHINTFCGRLRAAARITMELVDLYLDQGHIKEASQALQTVAKIYNRDGWGACHFLVHFRLAGFRRRGAGDDNNSSLSSNKENNTVHGTTTPLGSSGVSPRDYLATLVHCFSRYSDGSSNSVAPQKALELLCQDFEAVMAVLSSSSQSPSSSVLAAVAATSSSSDDSTPAEPGLYANSPIFDVSFKLPDAKKRKLFASQRKLPRKVFSVGDTVKISIGVSSYLPREIGGIVLSASLVPHKAYLAAQKQKRPVPPKDIFHTIELPDQVSFCPGENDFQLQWTPMISGQFVLSQITVCYKSANFVYSNDKMKELGFWLDILPVEPTQSLHVTPLFLIPGHKQRLQIELRSGKDHVEEGELHLICSPGLAVMPPEDEGSEEAQWLKSWKCPLKECPRGESQSFVVSVSGDTGESVDDSATSVTTIVAPSVHVKVATKFRHGNQDQKELFNETNEGASAHFQHEMESVIPTIKDSALTVKQVSMTPYDVGKAILRVSATCHVPTPFVLKNWHLALPSYLTHTNDTKSDLNIAVKDTTLIDGESISFAFDCSTVTSSVDADTNTQSTGQSTTTTLVAELQDEYGGIFHEKLALRLKNTTALPVMARLQQVHRMVVRVSPSRKDGQVGVPVQLTYLLVDTSPLTKAWEGRVYYSLDTDSSAWLVAGATKGTVSLDSVAGSGGGGWQLSFDAIPTAPGALSRMPTLSFTFEGKGLDTPYSIALPIVWEEEFRSWLPLKHSTVAFPVTNK